MLSFYFCQARTAGCGSELLSGNYRYWFPQSCWKTGCHTKCWKGLLDSIPARKKLMMIDACHSGEKPWSMKQYVKVRSFHLTGPGWNRRGRLKQLLSKCKIFANLNRGSGAMVISAAERRIWFMKVRLPMGVFTHSRAGRHSTEIADSNGDENRRCLNCGILFTAQVKTLTIWQKTPTSRQENLEFGFRGINNASSNVEWRTFI